MLQRKLLSAGIALALTSPAHAGESAELAKLRKEIEAMRASYETRIQALEKRLEKAEAQSAAAVVVAPAPLTTRPVPEPPSVAEAAPPAAAPVAAAPQSSDAAFNPAISLILAGNYSFLKQDPAGYAITGFPLPQGVEAGPGERGFNLGESELGLSANIDHRFRGAINIALHGDNSVSVEEAYVQTLGLDHGLGLKFGRFLSGIGYLNEQHAHTWDFVDAPLAYQAFVGGQFGDDGLQVRWLAPTDTYLEFGAEAGRGANYPGGDSGGNGAGAWSAYGHVGGDVGESHSWRAGLSYQHARANAQAWDATDLAGNSVTNAFSGKTQLWIADFVWKWAPMGNATVRNFKLQGEYLHRTQSGDLAYDTAATNSVDAYRNSQSGFYLQGIYQFMPGWRIGLRGEQLQHGTAEYGINSASLAASDYNPTRGSLMLDYSPSEFSRLRLQFTRDRSREGLADNQAFLQYQMSLGAHGAHLY
ncbi:TonB-dependent receptor [Niveibacterium umoris]|uniref:TonB-dependent receptor n=1 Tax=Niveibacterium umoris TaxID=1193620 RepID=A0A840BS92_9RHOO|nr:TonB-dependent receptor [Niveibacterium umoris]MBB4013696.1 hypothetical protein [Niveibacterium umoris]